MNLKKKKVLIELSLIEIFILVLFIFSQSYLISAFSNQEGGIINWQTNQNTADSTFTLGGVDYSCCLETKEGAICQNLISTQENICKENNLLPTSCFNVDSCKVGCCIDEEQGICTARATKKICEENGGRFEEDENCNIDFCQKGCCVIRNNIYFLTKQQCERKSIGVWDLDFRSYTNELDCIALRNYILEGACLFTEESNQKNSCSFLSQEQCIKSEGEFYENYLCSNPELNTTCIKQNSVSCVDGKEEIYWFDSCGNRENIYSSDKEKSWNNGFILNKEESCNPNSANINSKDCGNCNYILGSICMSSPNSQTNIEIQEEGFICGNLNCIDNQGNERINGESWCEYEGFIGEGKDVVGSRHFRKVCSNGVVLTEPCADYRGQVCAQSEFENEEGETYTQSSCVINQAFSCIDYNSKENMQELCYENTHCRLKEVNVDKGFKFSICTPNYPRGFDLGYNDNSFNSAREICGLANQECIVLYEKKISGWKCVFNCECEKKTFTKEMNDVCVSLGDCGAYVNILGEGTNSYNVRNSVRVSWQDYKIYSQRILSQFVEVNPASLKDFLEGTLLNPEAYEYEQGILAQTIDYVGKITGGIGTSLAVIGWATKTTTTAIFSPSAALITTTEMTTTSSLLGTKVVATTTGTGGTVSTTAVTTTTLGSFANALGAIGIGFTVATITNFAFGLQGDAALATTIAGALSGGTAGIAAGIATTSAGGAIAGGTALSAGSSLAAGTSLAAGSTITSGTVTLASGATMTATASAPVTIGAGGATVVGGGATVGAGGATLGAAGGTAGATGATTAGGIGGIATFGGTLGPLMAAFVWSVIIVVAVAIIMKVAGIGDTKRVRVQFECLPWQPPVGGEDCSVCNEDPEIPCSKYRCESLGKACGLINENTQYPECIIKYPNDGIEPIITKFNVGENYEIINYTFRNYELKKLNQECIEEFEFVEFSFETHKRAYCKFDLEEGKKFEEMENLFLEQNAYTFEHTGAILIPRINSSEIRDLQGNILNLTGDYTLNIKCQDLHGNENAVDYKLKTCVKKGVDTIPPQVTYSIPKNGVIKRIGQTEINLSIFIIEPAECRYDFLDKEYSKMQFSMECNTELEEYSSFGWQCLTTLKNLIYPENIFFIRCLDQPWLKGTENESMRNENPSGLKFVIYESKSKLKIDSITPENNEQIQVGVEPTSVKLQVKTSGGAYGNGNALCSYIFSSGREVLFQRTGNNIHEQIFQIMSSGDKNFEIICRDDPGNIATQNLKFNIEIDNSPPRVLRFYSIPGTNKINIITDEEANCYYTTGNTCNFKIEDAFLMSRNSPKEHFISEAKMQRYNIKCKDVWGNENPECAIVIQPQW